MLKIRYHKQFKKDLKLAIKQHLDINELKEVIELLQKQETLPIKYKDHLLNNSRDYKNSRECHIRPDWLLIYRIMKNELLLELLRTGSHSDLFR